MYNIPRMCPGDEAQPMWGLGANQLFSALPSSWWWSPSGTRNARPLETLSYHLASSFTKTREPARPKQ